MRVSVGCVARLSVALCQFRPHHRFDALVLLRSFCSLLACATGLIGPGSAATVSAQDTTSVALPAVRAFLNSDTTVTGARRVAGFEVRNTSGAAESVTLACFVEGPLDACTIAAPTLTLATGEAAEVVVRYETGASAGHGRVVLRASTSAGSPTAATDVVVAARPGDAEKSAQQSVMMAPGGIEVWFQHASITAEPNMPDGIETLFVENTNSLPDNVSLSCTRTGAVTGCSVVPSSVFLDAYEQIDVSVEFTTGASGSGTIVGIGGGSRDTLAVTIQSAGTPGAPIVSSSVLNPGRLQERSACVTSGAGPAGAFQCGELLVAHAMPAYRTMNRERSLTLLYNSATAQPAPVILANVSLGAQTAVPDSVRVALWVNGTQRKVVSYGVSGLTSGGGARRIAIPFDASSDATGIYPYSLTVTNHYTTSTHDTTVAGEVIVANRSASPYGAGWSVAGVEQIVTPTGTLASGRLLVGADGSGAYYSSIGTNTWLAPAGAYRDTLRYGGDTDPGGSSSVYWRRLLNGTKIYYDANGRQTWVEDRDGNYARYVWSSSPDRLNYIRISPYAQNKRYTFTYASNRLDYITDPSSPSARVLQATVNGSGDLTLLRNPGAPSGKEVIFAYSSHRMTSRQSAEDNTTGYQYFTGTSLLKKTTLPLTAAGTAVINYTPVKSRGLALATSGNTTYSVGSVRTAINGPRTVSDIVQFYENRYGAPIRVHDAFGAYTWIRYNALHPLLVDSVHYPNGRAIRMTYDSRARLTKSEDLTHSSGAPAVAYYRYNSSTAPESPDRVILPRMTGSSDTTLITYTAGQLTQIEDPLGHITEYTYNSAGQVETVTEDNVAYWVGSSHPTGDLVSRISYNLLGNPDSVWTPMGHLTTYVFDDYANISRVRNALGDIVDYHYTPMNLQDSIVQYDSAGSYRTGIAYDHDGNRTSLCDPRDICRTWAYDALGRDTSMTDAFGKSDQRTYDQAGNLTRSRNRMGDTIRTTYDLMNRPVTQYVGQVKVESSEATMYGKSTGTVLVPADSRTFQYDNMGRLQRAENNVAITWRDYTKEGAVSRDSQHVKVSPVTKHTIRYTYHPSGARKTMQQGGRTYTYSYDPGALLDEITWGSSERVSFTYDGLGRRTGMSTYEPGGVNVANTEYRLDKDGRMYRILSQRPGGSGKMLVDYEYTTLDSLGRPLLITDRSPVGGSVGEIARHEFVYDGRGQMIRQGSWPHAGTPIDPIYTRHLYDASGNRTWQYSRCTYQYATCDDTAQFVYYVTGGGQDPTNRLGRRVNWRDGQSSAYEEHEYRYDHDGNNIRDIWTDAALPPGQQIIHLYRFYSADAKLQSTQPTSTTANLFFLYDALGRRQRGAYADSTNLFFYDGENTVKFGFASFLPGPGIDEPLVAFFGSGNYCPGSDANSTNGYFTTSGNRLLDMYGDGTDDDSCIGANPWVWGKQAGAIQGSETYGLQRAPGSNDGMSFFRNRFYDPNMGRFTQEDPIGFAGGLNLYAYAGNNPASYTDPFGLCPVCDVADVGFFLWSAGRAIANPSRANLKNLGLDAAGLLPIIPSAGLVRRLDDVADAARGVGKIERHHQLPRQFRKQFEAAGLDIEKFTVDLPVGQHRLKPSGLHTGPDNWNKQWVNFFRGNPGATQEQILNQLGTMRSSFGLER